MASWAGALAAVQADLVLAAADVNALDASKDPFVPAPGEAISAIERRLRYWYDGDGEGLVGMTLSRNSVGEKLTIRWYWPVVNRDDRWISDLEVQLQAANRATKKYLMLDEHLKNAGTENAVGLQLGDGAAGWQNVGEAWIRVLTVPLVISMVDTEVVGTL